MSSPSRTASPSVIRIVVLLISILGWTGHTLAIATDDNAASNATAVFQDSSSAVDGQFVFAINYYQPNNSTLDSPADLYIHMSAPSSYQWMAVGLGNSMIYTVVWIAYPNRNGTGTTLSTRLALGHEEPAYADREDWGCTQLDAGAVANGTMTLDAVCRGIATWNGTNAYAPALQDGANNTFIYALGPRNGVGNHGGSGPLRSDDADAALDMHGYHGTFTMQHLANSSDAAGVPKPNGADGATWITAGASPSPTVTTKDGRDSVSYTHLTLPTKRIV